MTGEHADGAPEGRRRRRAPCRRRDGGKPRHVPARFTTHGFGCVVVAASALQQRGRTASRWPAFQPRASLAEHEENRTGRAWAHRAPSQSIWVCSLFFSYKCIYRVNMHRQSLAYRRLVLFCASGEDTRVYRLSVCLPSMPATRTVGFRRVPDAEPETLTPKAVNFFVCGRD